MDETMQMLAKKYRKLVRVAYFMWRKGKLLSHLNFMMMRGKISGKLEAIHNLIFRHHSSSASGRRSHRRRHLFPSKLNGRYFKATPPAPLLIGPDMNAVDSPSLPGFGPSPPVRQLRITDSPYPIRDFEEDNNVDEAADDFIDRFYKDLKRQNALAYFG